MKPLNYEIIDIHYKNDEIWGHLLNRNYERLQQLVLIAPLKTIFEYLESQI